ALHERGNCYVSLDRGEGWGSPLFDAVARGKPVIATAFAGPLDYLRADAARLVPFTLAPVRQPYVYYGPQMRWAEPDVNEAAAAMRDVYGDREAASARAASLAATVGDEDSVERVGAVAKERLLHLLRQRDHRRWRALRIADRTAPVAPPVPVPGEWYDADYFEHGVKSNWIGGYDWTHFAGVFRETAAYLTEMFPAAESFLDVGCAKGFLVRCLREAGRACHGVDHSAWAIDHADPAAQPFLIRSGVDDLAF